MRNIFCQTADWSLFKGWVFSQLQRAREIALFGACVRAILRQEVFPGPLAPGRV